MRARTALLVIGIHREELEFGRGVAEGLEQTRVTVLAIPDGISGKRPTSIQQFHYETLHRSLYLQLLPYVHGRHDLLIDLHTGFDPLGPSADIICADAALCARLQLAITNDAVLAIRNIRVIPLGAKSEAPHANTVIPRQIWENPAFWYVGLEIYLPEVADGQEVAKNFARELVIAIAECVAADQVRSGTCASA